MSLPNRLIPIHNEDKEFHERWKKGRNMLNFPHPFRMVAMGKPNCGKTTVVKNIIMRAEPPFTRIVVCHCDPENTKEYNDLGDITMLSEIPTPQEWEGDEEKTLVILDDMEFKGMGKEQKRNLDRLFGYVSTHKNISCILTAQDTFNIPTIVRRCSNLWVVWKCEDIDSMSMIARKAGILPKTFKKIFDTLLPGTRDSLWIDNTDSSPYKLRKNGYELISEL